MSCFNCNTNRYLKEKQNNTVKHGNNMWQSLAVLQNMIQKQLSMPKWQHGTAKQMTLPIWINCKYIYKKHPTMLLVGADLSEWGKVCMYNKQHSLPFHVYTDRYTKEKQPSYTAISSKSPLHWFKYLLLNSPGELFVQVVRFWGVKFHSQMKAVWWANWKADQNDS